MLKNFLITASRSFLRNKTFSILGILGLTMSMACVISIFTIINFQGNFDKHQENSGQIYRVISHITQNDQEDRFSTVPHPLSKSLRGKISGVSDVSNMYMLSAQLSTPNATSGVPKKISQKGVGFVEADLTNILTFEWLAGQADFNDRSQIALSASVAEKFFNVSADYESVLGKEILLGNQHRLLISAIYKDFPKNTDYPFQVLTAYDNQIDVNPYFNKGKNWGSLNGGTECLLKVNKEVNFDDLEASVIAIYDEHKAISDWKVELQAFDTIHYLPYGNYSGISFRDTYLIMSYGMMFFLILIGCINFINLSTARAINRSKEVGLRKIMGGTRFYLILQFLTESFLIVLISLAFGFFLAGRILIGFNDLMGGDLTLMDVTILDWTVFSVSTTLLLTILSGLYPALILSGFSPLNALKIKAANIDRQSKIPMRKVLVGLQFAFSIALIFGSAVMFSQINFLKNHDLGFESKGVMNINFANSTLAKKRQFKNQILALPQVSKASLCIGSPMAGGNNTGKYYNPLQGKDAGTDINEKAIDESYFDMFGLSVITGRELNNSDENSKNALVNENFVTRLGYGTPQEAMGKTFVHSFNSKSKYKIVGVVKDFNSNSLHGEIKPVMFLIEPNVYDEIAIKFNVKTKEELNQVIASVKTTWDETYPDDLINYNFLEESIANFYKFEDVMAKSISFFVIIAIILCCMGLYGLTDFIANARRKEFGIRKVVGANMGQLITAFVKEVLPTLSIAFLISGSLSYYLMEQWLTQFSYQIAIGWQIILFATGTSIILVFLAMGYRSFKAANLNPVKVLKDE